MSSESHKILNIATGKILYSINVKIEDKVNNKKIKLNKNKNDSTADKSTEEEMEISQEILLQLMNYWQRKILRRF